jgi:integrase
MVGIGWSRKYINVQVGRIIRMFRWGVENEKVEANVLHALRAVPGLRQGKTTARELPPIRPVPDSQVAAVLPHVPAPVKAMIELMQLTGARAGELVILRGSDIDMTGPVWQYRPEKHKTQFHGHERIIYLGPRAQDVVRPFLRLNPAEYLFRPDESIAAHREKRKAARKTPLSCGNCPGDVKQSKPKKLPGEHYSVGAFRQAIERGCDIAFPPPSELARIRVPGNKTKNMRQETTAEWKARLGERWTELKAWRDSHSFNPHQIRHSCATTIRKQYGLEVVQAVLGQKSVSASQIYAEKNLEAATRVMAEVG